MLDGKIRCKRREPTLRPAGCHPPISTDPLCARQRSQTRTRSSGLLEEDPKETSERKHTNTKEMFKYIQGTHSSQSFCTVECLCG